MPLARSRVHHLMLTHGIAKDKAAKDQSELEKVKKLLKQTQKELKKQRKAEQDRLDEINNDLDRLPPESEEEDAEPTVNLRASVRVRAFHLCYSSNPNILQMCY